ncbi:MAG: hypothetical protein K2M12_00760, partial [Muribaculaceae bacterium]|nr:hypothetical protein [Muribaculaceae bacterium]
RAYDHVLVLLYNASLYSFLLMALLIIPVSLEAEMLLKLWLREVPAYTAVFSRLSLLVALFELLVTVVTIGIHATGRVMRLSLISGSMNLLMLPVMYVVLRITDSPVSVYILYVGAMSAVLFVDTLILKYQMPQFSVATFWWRGVIKPAIVCGVAASVAAAAISPLQQGWLRLLVCGAVSTASLSILTWVFILPGTVKQSVRQRAVQFFRKNS